MTIESFIGQLSVDEKIVAMELIWRDLSRDEKSFESPGWHERVIAQRLANPEPGDAISLDAAQKDVNEVLNARRTSS